MTAWTVAAVLRALGLPDDTERGRAVFALPAGHPSAGLWHVCRSGRPGEWQLRREATGDCRGVARKPVALRRLLVDLLGDADSATLAGMGRHEKIIVPYPAWVDKLPSDSCLRSVAEDAYYAKALAEQKHRALGYPGCHDTLRAAEKSLVKMENDSLSVGTRCKEGDRAARKYWEAKACGRGRAKKQ